MCTVSHCRELLPPDYQYLRCDRHRLQNRHHSKLKRVRDKEVKAAAFNHWVVSVGGHKSEATPGPDNGPDPEEEHGRSYDQEGTPGTGFPPAARGMRRTNHVCIIKACFNLLSPTNPWRMCDVCRARDRAHRREKALRGNGTITSPPPDEGEGANQEQGEESEKVKKPKKKKKKKKPATVAQDGIVSADATAAVPQPPEASAQQSELQGTGLVFMSPLLPSQVRFISLAVECSLIVPYASTYALSHHRRLPKNQACKLPALTRRLQMPHHLWLVLTPHLCHLHPSRSSQPRRSLRKQLKPKARLRLPGRNGK